jgi:predicted SprT family Zn-dependent metalloprotease
VLLASRDALALVTAEQFSALAAHEIAHEYIWDGYREAMAGNDHRKVQELELRCDGIAVLTLRRLGLSAEHLISAVQTMTRFNQHRGMVASASDYVSLKDRVAFIRAIATMSWRDGSLGASTHNRQGSVTNRVLAYFDHLSKEQHLDEYLTLARPTPVSMRYKAAALANLPPNSNVQLSATSQAKLAALAPILEFYDRRGIIEPLVIGDNETVFIGLYERCALVITQKALDLLSKQEIQAVVAHELAHEWYWDEYRLARESKQDDKVQEIELRCDGIAILALVRLRLNPSQIISALRKMGRYDKDSWEANYYIALDERLAFARWMIKSISSFPTVS